MDGGGDSCSQCHLLVGKGHHYLKKKSFFFKHSAPDKSCHTRPQTPGGLSCGTEKVLTAETEGLYHLHIWPSGNWAEWICSHPCIGWRVVERGKQSWGEPVEVCCRSEKVLLTHTLCDLWVKKSNNHRMSWSSRWKRGESLWAKPGCEAGGC